MKLVPSQSKKEKKDLKPLRGISELANIVEVMVDGNPLLKGSCILIDNANANAASQASETEAATSGSLLNQISEEIGNQIALSQINLDYNPRKTAHSKLSFKLDLTATKVNIIPELRSDGVEILSELLYLRNLGITLRVDHDPNENTLGKALSGNLHGDLVFKVESKEYIFRNKVYLQDRRYIQYELLPKMRDESGKEKRFDVIEAADDLIRNSKQIFGTDKDSFRESFDLKNILSKVGISEITIDGIRLGYDTESKKFDYLALQNSVTFCGYRFFSNITILPDFTLYARLDQSTPIIVGDLLAKVGIKNNSALEGLCEAKIPKIELFAAPKTGDCYLVFRVDYGKSIKIPGTNASVTLKKIEFEIALKNKKFSEAAISAEAEIAGNNSQISTSANDSEIPPEVCRAATKIKYSAEDGWEFYLSFSEVNVSRVYRAITGESNDEIIDKDSGEFKKDALIQKINAPETKELTGAEALDIKLTNLLVYIAAGKNRQAVYFQTGIEGISCAPVDVFKLTPEFFYIKWFKKSGQESESSFETGLSGTIDLWKKEGVVATQSANSDSLAIEHQAPQYYINGEFYCDFATRSKSNNGNEESSTGITIDTRFVIDASEQIDVAKVLNQKLIGDDEASAENKKYFNEIARFC